METILIHFSVLNCIFFCIHLSISFRIVAWKMKNLKEINFFFVFESKKLTFKKIYKAIKNVG
jgi:hypothetical protein